MAVQGVQAQEVPGVRPAAGGSGAGPGVGSVLDGRYRLVRVLGQGGMGTVYLAEHLLLEQPVAIKVLAPERATYPDAIQRFQREARAAARVGHFGIVDVVDLGQCADGTVYMAMEYLPGANLAEILAREGPLDAARACALMRQLCDALQAAHLKGLVHRDLKSDNVMVVDRPGRREMVKVLDFGVAWVPDASPRLTLAGMVMGTPEFMAPEQARGQPIDHRADIYSCGVILYELLTGTLPFTAPTVQHVMAMQVAEAPEPPRQRAPVQGIPEDLEAVVLKALAKNPTRRFQHAREMAAALAGCEQRLLRTAAVAARAGAVESWLQAARDAVESGDLDHAVGLATSAVAAAGDVQAAALQPHLPGLERVLEGACGGLDQPLAVDRVPARLDPPAAFLLSRVDGGTTAEDLVALSPLPRVETLVHLAHLLQCGALRRCEPAAVGPAPARVPTPSLAVWFR